MTNHIKPLSSSDNSKAGHDEEDNDMNTFGDFGDKYNGTISVKLMSENLSLLMNLVSLPMSYSCINCFWCLTLMVEKENVFGHFLV